MPTGFKTIRDLLSYVLGAGILLYEVVFAGRVSIELIVAAMALIGLPFALGRGDPDGRDASTETRASWRA